MGCPLHDDHEPSLTFNVKAREPKGSGFGLFGRCTSGGCRASLVDVIRHFGLPLGRVLYEGYGSYREQAPKRTEKLTDSYFGKTEAYLHSHPDLLAYVTEARGVGLAVARRQRSATTRAWSVGRCRSSVEAVVWCYDPDAPKGREMRSAVGAKGSLYVLTQRRRRLAETIFVCEGEWDALVAVTHGLRAATGTLGALRGLGNGPDGWLVSTSCS